MLARDRQCSPSRTHEFLKGVSALSAPCPLSPDAGGSCSIAGARPRRRHRSRQMAGTVFDHDAPNLGVYLGLRYRFEALQHAIQECRYHRSGARHPAARACASSQNHRSPFAVLIFVLLYQRLHGA